MTGDASASERVDGSFRDPSGYLFTRGGRLYRAVDERTAGLLRDLERRNLLADLEQDGLLVPSRFVDSPQLEDELRAENPGWDHFLAHQPIEPVTYPSEWTVSMLADAGCRTLDLQQRLLEKGCALKDASAYNLLFRDGAPCFVDLASIEIPPRFDIWYALGQFQRMFLYPLLLVRRGWDLPAAFSTRLDGAPPEMLARVHGIRAWFSPSLFFDITLPLLLSRRAHHLGGSGPRLEKKGSGDGALQTQLLMIRRLRRRVTRLADSYRVASPWSGHRAGERTSAEAEAARRSFIERFLCERRPGTVLDLGCGTGTYSRLAARLGSRVIAVDSDHDAVERLYRQLRGTAMPITPAVVDLANPTPGHGFANRERPPFLERVGAECVLALGLLHHLLVTANLTLEMIRDLLHRLTTGLLVVEVIPPGDPMVRRLLLFRREEREPPALEQHLRVFGERFDLLQATALPGTERTLLFMERRR